MFLRLGSLTTLDLPLRLRFVNSVFQFYTYNDQSKDVSEAIELCLFVLHNLTSFWGTLYGLCSQADLCATDFGI